MNASLKFLVFILIVGLVMGAAGKPGAQAEAAQAPEELVLVLDLPQPESLAGYGRMNGIQAEQQAARWAREYAAPALQALKGLQAQGEVQSYRFDAQELAVHVLPAGSAGAALERLRELPGVAQITTPLGLQAFPVSYAQALVELFAQAGDTPQPAPDLPAITDPSIYVYALEGNPYTYVRGMTTPGIPVLVNARRNSAIIFSRLTYADETGVYRVYPDWSGGVYSWRLLPGDVVTVSAHSTTVNMTVVRLTAWIDPEQDAMLGYTEPSLGVLAVLEHDISTNLCESQFQDSYHGGTADLDGGFKVSFVDDTGIMDVPYNVTGMIEAFDTNGNYTWGRVRGFSLRLNLPDSSANLFLLPSANLTVSLKRGETVLQSSSGRTDYEGWYYVDFSFALQPGDEIRAVSGTVEMVYPVAPMTLVADPVSNTLSGTINPNQAVMLTVIKPGETAYLSYSLPFPTSCSSYGVCQSTTADGSGAFTLALPTFDLERGDALEMRLIADSGMEQSSRTHVPLVAALVAQRRIVGYWELGNSPVVVEVEDALSQPVASLETTTAADGYFEVDLPDLAAGYQVTVHDPVTPLTLTMQVAALTAEIDSVQDKVKGEAPASNLVLIYQDYTPATDSTARTCLQSPTAGGAYEFDLTASGIEAADQGTLYSRGADGHITSAYSHAFQLSLEVNSGTLTGFTPLPNTGMLLLLVNGDLETLEEAEKTSNQAGTFSHTFANHPLQTGWQVLVSLDAGPTEALTLPPLTLVQDAASDSVYGLSGALRPGTVSVSQWYSNDGTAARTKTLPFSADAGGSYTVSFAGQTWWDGTPVEVCGDCVSARLSYYTALEHQVALQGPLPVPVTADAYEDNDSMDDSSSYLLFSRHTFHTEEDEDWMRLDVTAAQVGKLIVIETFNLGLLEDTVLWVYNSQGHDLADDDDSGEGKGSRILFVPEAAGTYYIQVLPFDEVNNTGNCGSTYDLLVGKVGVLLPLVLR